MGLLFVISVLVAALVAAVIGVAFLAKIDVDVMGVGVVTVFGVLLLNVVYVVVAVIGKKGKAFFNFIYGLLIGVPFFVGIGGGIGTGVGYLLAGKTGAKIGGGALGFIAFILGVKCCIGLAREARPKQMKG